MKDDSGNEFEPKGNIIISGGPGGGREVEFVGKIDQLDENFLTVDGRQVFVDANSIFFDARGRNIKFSDLHVGQSVEVKANVATMETCGRCASRLKIEATMRARWKFGVASKPLLQTIL